MTIINTARNRVYACEPQPDDVLVQVGWKAPHEDGTHLRSVTLPCQPISDYQAAVDWAVGIADQMAHPLYVVPLCHDDILHSDRWTPYADMLATLTDQERGELRSVVVSSMCELMRDCEDREVRSEAYDILIQLKVIHHD